MFKSVALALLALSVVNGAPLFSRQNPPASYDCDILEPYSDYHTRYLAIGCQNQHNTQFFDDCCHPLKKGETLEDNRKPYCVPGANPSSTLSGLPANTLVSEPSSSPAPAPSPTPNSGDDDCDDDDNDGDEMDNNGDDDNGDDDCDDEPSSPPANEPASTPSVPSPSVPTPSENPQPTPTPAPEPSPSSTDNSSPSPTQGTPSNSETHTGGDLTWFTQNGVAGACGQVHSDNDFIAALDVAVYGDTGAQSSYCGKTIRITWQDKSVDVIVADACPTCDNASSVDLSQAAFQALAPLDTGLLTDATWVLL